MKHLFSAVALALLATAPVAASAGSITIDFERNWDGGNGDIANYYNGGKAAVGSAVGPSLGVVFANISGLNNDPAFPAFSGAPSPIGTAYAEGPNAFINIANGAYGFSFFYSSSVAVLGAVKAYSGLNGSGSLLATLDLTADDSGNYSVFNLASLAFGGTARSFDLSALASGETTALFDNVTVVPEPGILLLMVTGGALAFVRRKPSRR